MENSDKELDSNFKKSNVTTLEINTREQIESYHQVENELFKEIEELRKKGEDVSTLEITAEKLKEEFTKLSASLNNFETNEN